MGRFFCITPHISLLSKMDFLLPKWGGMEEQAFDALELGLDERNIVVVNKTVKLVDVFKERLDRVVSRVSRFEGKKGQETYDYDNRHRVFETMPLRAWGRS